MPQFKDNNGKTWIVSLDTNGVRRIRKELDFDLLDLEELRALNKIDHDPILAMECVYILCQSQAEEAKIGEEQFYSGIVGDAMGEATRALLEALADFFPRDRGEILKNLLSKGQSVARQLMEKLRAEIENPDLEAKLLAELVGDQNVSGGSSGDSPENSAATPAPTPLAN